MEYERSSFLAKARESLASAESDFTGGRYNSCANRCYYACFQAAVAALLNDGIRPPKDWGHRYVRGQFAGQLINRRKRFGTGLRRTLIETFDLRRVADYRTGSVSSAEARRALAQTREFVQAVEARLTA